MDSLLAGLNLLAQLRPLAAQPRQLSQPALAIDAIRLADFSHAKRIRHGVRLESHCDMSANRRRPIARETYSQNRQEFFLNMPGNNAA
ncbi:MAG: hypothetical protein CR217_16160 [Beijerinckiaceae bacterium]|nr:MAG: hypothetical protein CR217_16160 [Beijerinckiaceae bacterium]